MPRIAVVQDGTELARQTDADITGCFEACCTLLSADGSTYQHELFTDEGARSMLQSLDAHEFDSLVFASNALNAGLIREAVEEHQGELRRYLAAGGGLVVLHQVSPSLSAVLPAELCPEMVDRTSPRDSATTATASDTDDVLLHYPARVRLHQFADGGFALGPPSLFYRTLAVGSLPDKLKPVLRYGQELLVARSYDHVAERVVVVTLPLDWQRAVELLANTLRFASRGLPQRLVWYRSEQARQRRLLSHWLALDGTSSMRPLPQMGKELDETDSWLLKHIDVLLVPPDQLESVQQLAEVRQFVEHGGTVLAADDSKDAVTGSRITATVGRYTQRRLSRRLYAELRAVDGWATPDDAFALRNITTTLAFLWADPVNRTKAALRVEEIASLIPELRRRLSDERHREDLSSSIAHVQSLAALSGDQSVEAELLGWLAQDPRHHRPDVGVQIQAVTAMATRQPAPDFAVAALDALDLLAAGDGSLAAAVRTLEAIAILDEAGMLQVSAPVTKSLTGRICDLLEKHPCRPDVGWLSVEATADVSRGVVALLQRLGPEDAELTARAMDRLGAAVAVVRRGFPKEVDDPLAVARLSRLTHAVVLVDKYYPIGLQRLATIEWPESALGPTLSAGGERSLLDRLTVANSGLRTRELALNETIAARDQALQDSRVAAKLGRAAATLAAVALVLTPLVLVLISVGFGSVWTALGNIAVICTVLLAVVGGVFSLLARWHLLAHPAMRVREWISRVVPIIADLAKIKPK